MVMVMCKTNGMLWCLYKGCFHKMHGIVHQGVGARINRSERKGVDSRVRID